MMFDLELLANSVISVRFLFLEWWLVNKAGINVYSQLLIFRLR